MERCKFKFRKKYLRINVGVNVSSYTKKKKFYRMDSLQKNKLRYKQNKVNSAWFNLIGILYYLVFCYGRIALCHAKLRM